MLCELQPGSPVVLCDPLANARFAATLLDMIAGNESVATARGGVLIGTPGKHFATLRGDAASLPARAVGAEQSNTSVIYGDRLILKLFRRLDAGPNPEVEIGVWLTDGAGFKHSPAVAGTIEYRGPEISAAKPSAANASPAEAPASVAVLQALIANEGDAWTHTLKKLDAYFSQLPPVATAASLDNLALAGQLVASYGPDAKLLGRRTAEMHSALADNLLDLDFKPEPFDASAARALAESGKRELRDTLNLLADRIGGLPANAAALGRAALAGQAKLIERFDHLTAHPFSGQRIRCHGDYHLGQVLFTGHDFAILDFEGEPARSLDERCAKQSPLKDVAGMLRSFDYALAVATNDALANRSEGDRALLAAWGKPWLEYVSGAYRAGYEQATLGAAFVPSTPEEVSMLLDAFILEKAVYELRYELNNRPDWVGIPLGAIAVLAKS